MRIGSLFSGVGGLELGMEWAMPDAHTVWNCERDPYAGAVLRRHWPGALQLEDVHDVSRSTVPRVDLICGGFPCQPFSKLGAQRAEDDDRHLWPQFARVIGELEPRWVVVENVPQLLSISSGRVFGAVLGDLAALGFNAEWRVFSAAAVGAAHIRERLFLVAHADRPGRGEQLSPPVTGGPRLHSWEAPQQRDAWRAEPPVLRSADDVPRRLDRIRTLGNAVVPQAAQVVGYAVADAEAHWREFGVMPAQIIRPEHIERVRGTA